MAEPELKWVITNDFGGKDNVALEVELEGWEFRAYIKRDGCCEITKADHYARGKIDFRIHVCDVPQFIKILQSLEDFRVNNIDGAE